jgi:hypothetical protein
MKITPVSFLIFACAVCLAGLLTLAIRSNPNGRKPKEIDASGYYRIVKIEGREYIVSNKNLTPINKCCGHCCQDSVK